MVIVWWSTRKPLLLYHAKKTFKARLSNKDEGVREVAGEGNCSFVVVQAKIATILKTFKALTTKKYQTRQGMAGEGNRFGLRKNITRSLISLRSTTRQQQKKLPQIDCRRII